MLLRRGGGVYADGGGHTRDQDRIPGSGTIKRGEIEVRGEIDD